ncbi:FAD-dependent oxidoreductase [Verrucosispora sioxanthis]|uniref:FAD-dependent oxidoreductase n=1 Tax=Verrucosispora sioxanthis TaxID=2499994 RepID=A0A6M1L1B5_9ACTN|nr:FAD-dependent oxidoreductase [Verrucosispora sioxanthis]NEE64962.1 FAD-dependent oxidoreductase [Verrucosispora sioxanthis]NGM14072.1 FAD-dependent oxidoreductase [Verrucosispora sioxanthis]
MTNHAHEASDHPPHQRVVRRCDVAVIGGSAAGLAAALQLARQRRSVIVVDDGTPRNAPAAHMHGYLGREGTPPEEMRAIGREEVRSYGGNVLTGRVLAVRQEEDGFHLALSGGHGLVARRVLAATGIVDELPDIEGLAERWGAQVFNCPFCHGWEVRDLRVVQIVTTPMGLHPTQLMRHLTDRLTVVLHDATGIDPAAVQTLVASGVAVVESAVRRVADADPDGSLVVELADGRSLPADAILTGARFRPRVEMLAGLGIDITAHPSGLGDLVAVDSTGRTSVPGVFAAGNLTDPSAQVLPAAANGSWIGAQIAFSLAAEDTTAGLRPSGVEIEWDGRYGDQERVWSANPNGTLVAEATDLPPGRALDVGAGEGADALWLAERGWQVTASDVSGRALDRIRAEAERRGLDVRTLHRDANDPAAYADETYDLVSLQYGSFQRTPEQRGLRNLLDAVAVGGTLLVVGHDLTWLEQPSDPGEQTRMYDPQAYVGIDEIAAALTASGDWRVAVNESRPRPPGAISTHHVNDVVLRAVRLDHRKER